MTGELIPISDEQAKAVQEIVKAFRGLGAFVERALGSTPENLVGYLFGDRLAIRRAENAMRMMQEARQRLEERDVTDPRRPSLWARLLLANAMDPKLGTVRYSFIEAVKAMDPMDARVAYVVHAEGLANIRCSGDRNVKASESSTVNIIAESFQVRGDQVLLSIEHLEELNFLMTREPGDKSAWYPTPKLREFMRACYPEQG